MPGFLKAYVRIVDRFNRIIGRMIMWGFFVMVAILLWSSLSKILFVVPAFWTLEVSQFALVTYYLVGGAYSIQLGSNVRMDLFYGEWSERKKAFVDSVTVLLLIFYLVILLVGGVDSVSYAIEYQERSPSLWRPLMWPVKVIMCFGIFLMILQSISELIKDVAKVRGVEV